MEEIIDSIILSLGVEPAILMGVFALLSLVCRLVGKAIPDTATGWQGVVRRICKILGLYVSNRIAPQTSVNDMAKSELLDRRVNR